MFGVDKRQNTWTRDFDTLLQDLAGHYPAYLGGIGGVEYPEVDLVVHMAAHAKVHQLVRQPHRALENAIMTFNVLEYCRGLGLPLVFSSTREVYGDVHRFGEYPEEAANFAYTESPYSASKITSEAFIYSYARCYGLNYLVFRFSNVYGRFDIDLQRMDRVLPLFMHQLSRGEPITIYGGHDKVLDFTYIDDCVDGIARGVEALGAGTITNQTLNLAYGEGNTLVRAAELIAAELGVAPEITLAPSLMGEVTRYVADVSKARSLLQWSPETPLDEGIPKAVAWFREWRASHPEEDRPFVRLQEADDVEQGFKQPATAGPLGPRSSRSTARRPLASPPSPRRSCAVSTPRSSRPIPPRCTRACRSSPPRRIIPLGSSERCRCRRRSRSARTSSSRTRRSTRSSRAVARRSWSAAPVSTCVRRSRASSCRHRPPRASASGGSASTTTRAPRRRTRPLSRVTRQLRSGSIRTTGGGSCGRWS